MVGDKKFLFMIGTFQSLSSIVFMLCQIGTVYMIIVNWGVEDLPLALLGSAIVELALVPVMKIAAARYHQRTIVARTVIMIEIVLLLCSYSYSVSTTVFWRKFFSGALFIAVDVAAKHIFGFFWELLEQSCTREETQQLFRVVNYGVISRVVEIVGSLSGLSIFFVPWWFFMTTATMIPISCGMLICCVPLIWVIAPKPKHPKFRTPSDAAKDRRRGAIRAAKVRKATLQAACKQLPVEQLQKMKATDFHVSKKHPCGLITMYVIMCKPSSTPLPRIAENSSTLSLLVLYPCITIITVSSCREYLPS